MLFYSPVYMLSVGDRRKSKKIAWQQNKNEFDLDHDTLFPKEVCAALRETIPAKRD